jgi:hypothetical protein
LQTVSDQTVSVAREVFEEDIVAAAERIFGVKATEMTEKEKREFALAEKYNALIWKSLPASPGKVKIEVLVEKKLPVDKG